MIKIREIGRGSCINHYWEYRADTHWSSICEVYADGRLKWGSGGINNGFTYIEIADAMIQAFTMAKERLIQIEKDNEILHPKDK